MEYSELYQQRIRSLCNQRHISINKLATMSGVKQSTLSSAESRKIRVHLHFTKSLTHLI